MMNQPRIVRILMERDNMTEDEAYNLYNDAHQDFQNRLEQGASFFEIEDFCEEWFGLEPDYLEDMINSLI